MIHKNYKAFLLFLLAITPTPVLADNFSASSHYEVCFTPPNHCATLMIREIDHAKREILMQAYHITDTSIVDAIVRAKKRGVDVKVLLDKSQINSEYTARHVLERNGIKVLIDNKPAIAHNKIIIIDGLTVLGGSYNHTNNAAKRNAENMTIIKDHGFARKYVNNWHVRETASTSASRLK